MYKNLVDSVVADYELTPGFSAAELAEAKQAAAAGVSESGRLDLREMCFVTIDDPQASDFDDAVHCECLESEDGSEEFLLSVVIADVAAYVKPGSALDTAAARRGNSVYLPGQTFPMLPPVLSSDTCSLLPATNKAGVLCQIHTKNAHIHRYRFARCVINSKRRLSYEEAEAMVAQPPGNFATPEAKSLVALDQLAQILRRQRREGGGMVLALPEKKCWVDNDDLQVTDSQYNRARQLIEEAMILANRCAADFLIRNKQPALHRIHMRPPAENIAQLKAVLTPFHLLLAGGGTPQASDFSDLLETVEAKDPRLLPILLPHVLGALARAEYTPDETTGHFGLACDRYLHFTSPIRRYPDLLAHRAIIAVLENSGVAYTPAELAEVGKHCSEQEKQADKASWDCHRKLMCSQAVHYQGGTYEGDISGFLKFGFFVRIPELELDGMVRFAQLRGYWQFDEKSYTATAGDEQEALTLGMRVKVKIDVVNAERGRVDLSLVNVAARD